jgi:hypothetical protein
VRPAEQKAQRLIDEHRIHLWTGSDGRLHAEVRGDSGTYAMTFIRGGHVLCPCKSSKKCSHALAVEQLLREGV